MVRILGGLLRLNERAANKYFWWLDFTAPPTDVEETFKNFLSWKNHSVAIKVTENTWHSFAVAVF